MVFKTHLLIVSFLALFADFGLSQSQGKCTGQSCAIAALVGSSNESYEDIMKASGQKQPKAKGGANTGKSCLTKYFKELGIKAPAGVTPSRFAPPVEGSDGELVYGYSVPEARSISRIEPRQGCKTNVLLFARGTTEPGTMGMTVGPSLQAAATKFSAVGVSYSADIEGINCIGLPGGVKCRDQLAKMAASCPKTNFVLGGYSQGAMVARLCAAYSTEEVRKRIKGVVTFGDPFNGASVKGLPNDYVKTFCPNSDGVCHGEFSITAGHLSYGAYIGEAAKWVNSRAV